MVTDIHSRNNVKRTGHGTQPLLFAHGFGCDQHMWRFVAPAFTDTYEVIQFDYVGSGQSDRSAYDPQRYNSLHGYAQDVLDICEALDLHNVVFVGHSVSGVIGLLAAIEAPALFDRLVLLCPSPRYIDDPPDYTGGFEQAALQELLEIMDKNYMGWAQFLAPVVMQNDDRPQLTEELEASFCSTDPTIMRQFAEVTFLSDNRADLPNAPVPSLILQSREDAIAPPAVGAYMHRRMPHSTLRYLDVSGHCPHLSDPAVTVDAIASYLRHPADSPVPIL